MDQEHVSRHQLLEKIRDLDMLNRQLLREKEEETRLEYAWTGNLGHWYWNVNDLPPDPCASFRVS